MCVSKDYHHGMSDALGVANLSASGAQAKFRAEFSPFLPAHALELPPTTCRADNGLVASRLRLFVL